MYDFGYEKCLEAINTDINILFFNAHTKIVIPNIQVTIFHA